MKKIFFGCLSLALLALIFEGCKKDETKLVAQSGSFSANALVVSKNTVVLSDSTKNDSAISFSWSTASFGSNITPVYILQLDNPADTSGAHAWANADSVILPTNALHYSFTGQDFNNMLNAVGILAGVASPVAVRVKAEIMQYNDATSRIAPAYSNTVIVNATSFHVATMLYVPGAYQNWSPATAPLIGVADTIGRYEGYVYFGNNNNGQSFKYTNAPDWNHINYGDGGGGTLTTDGTAAGLTAPTGGYYELTADLNKKTWTATKTDWSIIGDATPGGWNTDTPMMYDSTNQVWKVTVVLLKAGSFKFRANKAWVIDFGVDKNGKLTYADNPFFKYNSTLNNLTVATDGTYDIVLDLHVPGNYTYSLTKH